MFKGLFGKNSGSSGNNKTGIYKIEENTLFEFEEHPGNGSINSIIQQLGYELTQIHTIHTFDSPTIECIGVKIFTKEAVFILAKGKRSKVDFRTLEHELKNIDWNFEYSSHTVEDILTEGIETQTLSFDFLNSVIKLTKEGDSLFRAPSLRLYLNFKNNFLESFISSDWSNSASKWLIDVNKQLFDNMLAEAIKYHRNEIEAMEEVNIQCEAFQGIPYAIKNEFIPLHTKNSGNINFYNLLVAHYDKEIHIDEFKSVNKGRFNSRDERILEVDKFVFQFGEDGLLVGSTQK